MTQTQHRQYVCRTCGRKGHNTTTCGVKRLVLHASQAGLFLWLYEQDKHKLNLICERIERQFKENRPADNTDPCSKKEAIAYILRSIEQRTPIERRKIALKILGEELNRNL